MWLLTDNEVVDSEPVTWDEEGRQIPLTEAEKTRLVESAISSGSADAEQQYMPIGEPRRHRLLQGMEGTWFEWMLDPFFGSGTTGAVAKKGALNAAAEQTEARRVQHLSMAGQTGHTAQYRSDFAQIFFSGIFQILIITQHIGRGDRTQPKPCCV